MCVCVCVRARACACVCVCVCADLAQRGTADAEIKVPFAEISELSTVHYSMPGVGQNNYSLACFADKHGFCHPNFYIPSSFNFV